VLDAQGWSEAGSYMEPAYTKGFRGHTATLATEGPPGRVDMPVVLGLEVSIPASGADPIALSEIIRDVERVTVAV
jgi:hypothetical protein